MVRFDSASRKRRIVGSGIGHTVADVLVEEADGDALQGFGDCADLGEDVDAVRVFVDHSLKPTDLAFDALESLDDVGELRQGVGGEISHLRIIAASARPRNISNSPP